jgi:hypothetical protein
MRLRLRHLPVGLAVSAGLLLVGAVVGGLLRGTPGAVGFGVGVLLVAVSFVIGSAVIAWADIVDRRLILPVGLLTYAVKFSALGLVMFAVADSGWAGMVPLGFGIAAGALAWIITQSVWTWKARILYVDV